MEEQKRNPAAGLSESEQVQVRRQKLADLQAAGFLDLFSQLLAADSLEVFQLLLHGLQAGSGHFDFLCHWGISPCLLDWRSRKAAHECYFDCSIIMASCGIVNKNDASATQKPRKKPRRQRELPTGPEDVKSMPSQSRFARQLPRRGEPLACRSTNTDCLGFMCRKMAGPVLNRQQLHRDYPASSPVRRRRGRAFRAGSRSGRTRW